jgi:hypothetical protein
MPLLKIGALVSTCDLFLQVYDEKTQKKRHMRDRLHLLAAILALWWRSVASTQALDLLHWAMRVVLYLHTVAAIKMASKSWSIFS